MENANNKESNILVFAGKRVGLELLKYLVELSAPISKVITPLDENSLIREYAYKNNIQTETYSGSTQVDLVEYGFRYSWLLNLWSPFILKQEVLDLADNRLNVHPGMVPHCRGQDCAAWSIRKSLPAGVSLLEMSNGVDEGQIYSQKEVFYKFPITGKELHERLQLEAIELFREKWPLIYIGSVKPFAQNGPVTTHRRRDTDKDRILDASQNMQLDEMVRWIMAHDFQPGTTAVMKFADGKYKINLRVEKILETS